MLTIESLTVTHGRTTAVDNVSWELGTGVHALLGPNGAGKSSLLAAVATLKKPASGSIRFSSPGSLQENLGYLPQDNSGRSRFTVEEFLRYAAWLKKLSAEVTASEIDRVLTLADLKDKRPAKVRSLSGGMKRRLGIAAAVLGAPPLVILDEASSGLDIAQRAGLETMIRGISNDATVITSTHIIEDVVGLADTVTVMDEGRFLFRGSFEDLAGTVTLDSVKAAYLDLIRP